MAKANKQSYETKWQKAFEEAEVQPSAQLWKNIESDLNATENAKFKRRLLYYRTVAAAAVACMVILGVYTWSNEFGQFTSYEQKITADNEQTNSAADLEDTSATATKALTENTDKIESTERENSLPNSVETAPSLAEAIEENSGAGEEIGNTPGNQLQISDKIDKVSADAFAPPLAENTSALSDESNEKEKTEAQMPGDFSSENALSHTSAKQPLMVLISAQGIDDNIIIDKSLNEPVGEIYPIPIMPKERKKDFEPVFFAELNLSTDYFNPNYNAQAGQALAAPPNAFFADQAQEAVYALSSYPQRLSTTESSNLGEENTAQLSFSYGANFGMAVSKHWTVESGVAYSKYNTSTQTSAAFQGIAAEEAYPVSLANSSADHSKQFSSVRYEQTDLTNTFDFVAIPLKVAYNLRFDKVSIVFGTGAAANFLLQNSISDEAGQLNEVVIRPDESSPFRKVYYSGILSSGIHYQLMGKYAFSITPSYNFSISSLTKSASNFMSLPYTFGVDFGIRYQF